MCLNWRECVWLLPAGLHSRATHVRALPQVRAAQHPHPRHEVDARPVQAGAQHARAPARAGGQRTRALGGAQEEPRRLSAVRHLREERAEGACNVYCLHSRLPLY